MNEVETPSAGEAPAPDPAARQQPAAFLYQAEFVQHVGANNIVPNIEAALLRARQLQTDDALKSSAVS